MFKFETESNRKKRGKFELASLVLELIGLDLANEDEVVIEMEALTSKNWNSFEPIF